MEDVYHVTCGHWADRPRIYHRCVGAPDQPENQIHTIPSSVRLEQHAGKYRDHGDPRLPKPGMRMSTPCTNAITCGSVKDVTNKCGRCRIDVEKIAKNQTGMWFSVSRDPVTGKTIFKDRQGESAASQRARLKKEPRPHGTRKPCPTQSTEQEDGRCVNEDTLSRSGSWSSHGHVEL